MIDSKMIAPKWSKVKWLTQNDRLGSWKTFRLKWSVKWLAPKWSTEGCKNCPAKWSTKWSTAKWSMLDVTGKKTHYKTHLRGLGGRKQATWPVPAVRFLWLSKQCRALPLSNVCLHLHARPYVWGTTFWKRFPLFAFWTRTPLRSNHYMYSTSRTTLYTSLSAEWTYRILSPCSVLFYSRTRGVWVSGRHGFACLVALFRCRREPWQYRTLAPSRVQ